MDRASVDTLDAPTYRGLLISSHMCTLFRSFLPPSMKAGGCARGGRPSTRHTLPVVLVYVDDRHRLCYFLGFFITRSVLIAWCHLMLNTVMDLGL